MINQPLEFSTEQLLRRLENIRTRMSGPGLIGAARIGAELIAVEWRLLFRAASAPSIAGLPPRILTGQYQESIDVRPDEQDETHCTYFIGPSITDPNYPRFLEFGTIDMPAHPIARPAYDISVEKAARAIAQEFYNQVLSTEFFSRQRGSGQLG